MLAELAKIALAPLSGGRRAPAASSVGGPPATRSRFDVAKLDEKYASPGPMLGDLDELDDAREPRTPSQHGGDVSKRHLKNRRYHDLPGSEGVPTPNANVRALPKPNARSDLAVADALSQSFEELHGHLTVRQRVCQWRAVRIVFIGSGRRQGRSLPSQASAAGRQLQAQVGRLSTWAPSTSARGTDMSQVGS
jgi:hypothetical protein